MKFYAFSFTQLLGFGLILLSISSCVSKKKYNELGQYYENIEVELSKARKEITNLKHELAVKDKLGESEDLPITTIKFDKLEHNFGAIALGEEYSTKFTITNTGKEPLVFTSVKGSCTCTVPEFTKKPISPGETGKIEVTFTPGLPIGEQIKYVTIMANTKSKIAVISVKGEVRKNQ